MLTVIRLPEVNKRPVEPDLRLALAFAVCNAETGDRQYDSVGADSLEPVIVPEMRYTPDQQVDAQAGEDRIDRGA